MARFCCFSCVGSGHEQAESRVASSPDVFELGELTVATDRFDPQRVLGEGKSGQVYKGMLVDGQVSCCLHLLFVFPDHFYAFIGSCSKKA